MAYSYAGPGARLSKNGKVLIGAGADATYVAKLPLHKLYDGTVKKLTGNLTVVNSQGREVINAHIPIIP